VTDFARFLGLPTSVPRELAGFICAIARQAQAEQAR
jgi:hypothetical protein